MNQLNLKDNNYPLEVLSYYLWGQPKAPTPTEIADEKFIRPFNESTTVQIDAQQYMEQIVRPNFELGAVKLFETFFSGKTRSQEENKEKGYKKVLPRQITVSDLEDIVKSRSSAKMPDGSYSLTHTEFVEKFYPKNTGIGDNTIKDAENAELPLYHYDSNIDSPDYWMRAFVFGSTKFELDKKSIRYIFDEKGEPRRLEGVRVKPMPDDFNFESSTGIAKDINPILDRIMDPSGIGRTVKFNFGKNEDFHDLAKDGTYTQEDWHSYLERQKAVRKREGKAVGAVVGAAVGAATGGAVGATAGTAVGAAAGTAVGKITGYAVGALGVPTEKVLQRIKMREGIEILNSSNVYDYLDSKNRLVIFGTMFSNNINGTITDREIDLNNILSDFFYNTTETLMNFFSSAEKYQKYIIKNGITYIAGGGKDTVTGTDYNDHLMGNADDDILKGEAGNDYLYGGYGEDTLSGGTGDDVLYGANDKEGIDDVASDTIYGGLGNDYIAGGAGDDMLYGATDEKGVYDNGADIIYGGLGSDKLYGGNGSDKLYAGNNEKGGGDTSTNLLHGGNGSDYLYGDFGNDTLIGGSEDDYLYGNGGLDTYEGGFGSDSFYIRINSTDGALIKDTGVGDKIYIVDDKEKITRLRGGTRNKDELPVRTFISDDRKYIYHVDENNNLAIVRTKDVLNAGKGDLKKGVAKMFPASASSNAGGNASGNGNSGVGTVSGGDAALITPEPLKAIIPDYKNGDFGIILKEDPKEKEENRFSEPPVGNNTPNTPSTQEGRNASCPIIIDLDGNGVQTHALESQIVRFDLDNNGFAERVGWTDGTDGFLVRDIDGNGRIGNGGELFGNHTKLRNGQKAANGFEALKELDDNGDGKITRADKVWSELRVWQDRNQDAWSAKGELYTLDELGIAEIDTAYSDSKQVDAAGNAHKQISAAVKQGGTRVSVADVWFTADLADTRQTGSWTPSEAISRLPEIRGFGNVPDLRRAMAANPALQATVENYLAADKTERKNLLDSLVYQWTGADKIKAEDHRGSMNARELAVLEALTGEGFLQRGVNPNPTWRAAEALLLEYNAFLQYVAAHLQAQGKPIFEKSYLDEKSDDLSYNWAAISQYLIQLKSENKVGEIAELVEIANGLVMYEPNQRKIWYKHVLSLIDQDREFEKILLDGFVGSEKDEPLFGNGMSNLLVGFAGNDTIHGGSGDDFLVGGTGNDKLYGGEGDDTYVFAKGHGSDLVADYQGKQTFQFADVKAGEVQFRQNGDDLILFGYNGSDSVRVVNYFYNERDRNITFQFADKTVTLDGLMKDGLILQGTEADETITGWSGRNELYGHAGNDTLHGNSQNDILDGGAGNDALGGKDGNDILNGGAGNDELYGDAGNDVLTGGTGDDKLYGGEGDDTYVFAKGHGSDLVADYQGKQTFLFADVKAGEVQFRQNGDDLILFGYNGSDSVRVTNYFLNEIDRNITFQFAEQTIDKPDIAHYTNAANNLVQTMAAFGNGGSAGESASNINAQSAVPLLAMPIP